MSNAADPARVCRLQTSRPQSQRPISALVLALLAFGAVGLSVYGWRQSVLFLIGGLFGLSLYHASFGFSSAYRRLFVSRDVRGVLAQLWMLAIATLLFAPVLAAGSVLGQAATGSVAPVSLPGAVGAFVFGVGMQLGSGCACGTLYAIGGGSSSMLITLLAFCLGSFGASLTRDWWAELPSLPPLSLFAALGWLGVALQLGVLLLIAALLWRWRQHSPYNAAVQSLNSSPQQRFSCLRLLLYGPWPLALGASVLALLNWLTLLIAGRPWGVTWGFTLWTAKLATALGWDPATDPFWGSGPGAGALSSSVFADVVSVMNLGIVLGAALAAALVGRLTLRKPSSWAALGASLIGGLLMGYGAWLAFGCNVGAYFSGIASTSLHGWLWIACALLGTAIGIRLRPLFQLSND